MRVFFFLKIRRQLTCVMLGEPRHSVESNEIVVEIDCTERPFSGADCDFGVNDDAADSCVLPVDVDGAVCPAALLNRLSSSLTKPVKIVALIFRLKEITSVNYNILVAKLCQKT